MALSLPLPLGIHPCLSLSLGLFSLSDSLCLAFHSSPSDSFCLCFCLLLCFSASKVFVPFLPSAFSISVFSDVSSAHWLPFFPLGFCVYCLLCLWTCLWHSPSLAIPDSSSPQPITASVIQKDFSGSHLTLLLCPSLLTFLLPCLHHSVHCSLACSHPSSYSWPLFQLLFSLRETGLVPHLCPHPLSDGVCLSLSLSGLCWLFAGLVALLSPPVSFPHSPRSHRTFPEPQAFLSALSFVSRPLPPFVSSCFVPLSLPLGRHSSMPLSCYFPKKRKHILPTPSF